MRARILLGVGIGCFVAGCPAMVVVGAGPCQAPAALCKVDGDCCTGNCFGGLCSSHLPAASCTGRNTACERSLQCCDGLDCSDAGACCIAGRSPVTCSQATDCCSTTCNGGVCCNVPFNPCSVDSDCCESLVCNRGRCTGACLPDGGCGDTNHVCFQESCLIRTEGGWCVEDTDCLAKCVDGHCHCGILNNYCQTDLDCCKGTLCDGQVCKIAKGFGTCNVHGDCLSGQCNFSDNDCL